MSDDLDALEQWRERQAERELAAARARNAAAIEVGRLRNAVGDLYIFPEMPSGEQPTDQEVAGLLAGLGQERIGKYDPIPMAGMIDSPQQALYGQGPGYGPERTAAQLEGVYGRLEDTPSWMNSRQFADAAGEYRKEQGGSEEAYRHARFLMAPERYEYMQSGPGRTVDLLRGLRADPEAAMQFYDRSRDARTTRTDYGNAGGLSSDGANYQRFSGFGAGAAELFNSPLSPIGRYLRVQDTIPSALRWEAAGASPVEAYGWTNALQKLMSRVRVGENEIMDIPDRLPGESDEERAERYSTRRDQVLADVEALSGPTSAEIARHKFGQGAPAALGAGLGMLYGLADATLPVSALRQVAQTPASWLARNAARAAARSSGVSGGAARAMMNVAERVNPGQGPLAQGARVAAYRGVPASAYADQLRPASLRRAAAHFAANVAKDEIAPEAAFEAGASLASGVGPTAPVSEIPEDVWQKQQADKRKQAEYAAVRAEQADRTHGPNPIRHDFEESAGNQWWLTYDQYRRLGDAAKARR